MKEVDYWQMTMAEAIRELEAKVWMLEEEHKTQAHIAYGQAITVGSCIASIFGSSRIPDISEIYPEYFPRSNVNKQKMDKSIENFIKFANAHNKKSEE